MIFDRDGTLLDHWGEDLFTRAHGIHIGPDGLLYLTDDGDHSVRKCTPDGKVLLTIGSPGKPAPFMSGTPFCRCTDVALSPKGEIYISDGYFNARIHKYSPDGKLLLSWGEPGMEHGQFNVPHNVCCDAEGWVYVADRESHRIQVFDRNGKYETQWTNVHRPNSIDTGKGPKGLFYVGEGGAYGLGNRHVPNLGPRISVHAQDGSTIAHLGTLPAGTAPDRFLSPHGLCVDSHGDIYVGEAAYSVWPSAFPDAPSPNYLRTLRKLVRL
jgi:sugar lactone lactonase YvrE